MGVKNFLKEYWLSIAVISFMAVIIICSSNVSLTNLAENSNKATQLSSLSSSVELPVISDEIDIPALQADDQGQLLYRKGYIVSYNKETKLPNWVAWHLTSDHLADKVRRPGSAFHEDLSVPKPRATNDDYKGSGWSRGHMCPAGDNKWDSDAMYESFLLSNVCPQHSNLNSGVWNQIEISCRNWAKKYGDIYVICGPFFLNTNHVTIGENKIVVPEAFFKVVLCLNGEPKGIGFICRNTDGSRKKDLYVNTISQVERITKITFFPHLNTEVSNKVKSQADLQMW